MDWPGEDMEPQHHPVLERVQGSPRQSEQLISRMPNYRKPKRKRSANPNANPKRTVPGTRQRDWTEAETSALLKFVNSPEFRPQRRTRNKQTDWERIVEAMQRKVGPNPAITVKRCKERMKTLTGERYFRSVSSQWERMKNEIENPTEDALRKLIVAHGLTEDWYKAIREYKAIQGPCEGQVQRPPMQTTDGPSEDMDLDPHSLSPDGISISRPSPADDDPPQPIQYARRFNCLNKLQRSTLLDLNFFANFPEGHAHDFDEICLSKICECLSIVQNRSCLPIYEDVIALEKMGLVRRWGSDDESEVGSDDDEEITSESYFSFSGLLMHEKFFKKAVDRNPAYDTRRTIKDDAMVTFDATRALSGITMLFLHDCEKLAVVDMSGFRDLRFLAIWECPNLREMIGCECLEELRWLEIRGCHWYEGYPPLQRMPSLQAFRFDCPYYPSQRVLPGGELDVSGCVRLRILEIENDYALSSIRGLEGLLSLTALRFWGCEALRNLPDIGHMKDLTHLLVCDTPVEEIKGVEKLSSLKELRCSFSGLKTLRDLGHLPHLKSVNLSGCPVVGDPSSPYYRQPRGVFKCESKPVDVSDSE